MTFFCYFPKEDVALSDGYDPAGNRQPHRLPWPN